MPFTGSHPAAVLPLLGLGLPASALVIGSLTPDMPYYFPVPVTPLQTHSLAGALGVDLVLGICGFLVWHLLLVPPLVWASPEGLQKRIPDNLSTGRRPHLATAGALGRVCVALVIGALTHVAWDSFTHSGKWGQRHLPWLDTTTLGFTGTRWLHLVSSLAGLAYLAWFLARWWRRAPTIGTADPVRPAVRGGIALLLFGWAGLATARMAIAQVLAPGRVVRQALVIGSIIEFISTLTVSLIGAAVLWHVLQAVQANRTGRSDRSDRDRVTTGSP